MGFRVGRRCTGLALKIPNIMDRSCSERPHGVNVRFPPTSRRLARPCQSPEAVGRLPTQFLPLPVMTANAASSQLASAPLPDIRSSMKTADTQFSKTCQPAKTASKRNPPMGTFYERKVGFRMANCDGLQATINY